MLTGPIFSGRDVAVCNYFPAGAWYRLSEDPNSPRRKLADFRQSPFQKPLKQPLNNLNRAIQRVIPTNQVQRAVGFLCIPDRMLWWNDVIRPAMLTGDRCQFLYLVAVDISPYVSYS